MKKHTSSLPLLVIVAVIALVIGTFGTAEAAGLTKKKVKQIATKVVHKEAPKLSVAHATTADTATNAGNATNLNGQPSTTYLNRVAFSVKATTAIAAGPDTEIGVANITVPASTNFLHIVGETTFGGGNTFISFWYALDQVCNQAINPGASVRTFTSSQPAQQSATVNQVAATTAGAHTVRLCANASAASGAFNTALSLETVQVGATGGTTLRPPAGTPSDGDGDFNTAR